MASNSQLPQGALAIIGMAGRFPGAANVAELWQHLCDGVESIRRLTDEELRQAGVAPEIINRADFVAAAAPLDQVQMFAASFFGFAPREAQITDPQQRIFLECAWECLEDAGYVPSNFSGRIGVYAGAGDSAYLLTCLLPQRQLADAVGLFALTIGNKPDYMPMQVSYRLNLRGPSVSVGTACSTSMVAVHLACQSLLNYECDLALAGGAHIELPQVNGYFYQEGGVASPDGHCRAFDARAQGTVSGNGVGVVMLKRLEEAAADGDHIYAVILASAINNDGAQKIGFTAPSIDGQAAAIANAIAIADIDPRSIGYVEAHGSGTPLGDPIEIKALTNAFRIGTAECGFCAVGSIKPNIGHLDAAAGVVSLIKAALCLEHRRLVPSISFTAPNPLIDFASTPFFVNTQTRDWQSPAGTPRRAAVNSLGMGGTNAHVILEEWLADVPQCAGRTWKLLPVSARSEQALQDYCDRLGAGLAATNETSPLEDVAYTLQVGRTAFTKRCAFLCDTRTNAAAMIRQRPPRYTVTGTAGDRAPAIVFMLPGMGDQYAGMAWGLYEREPVFRRCIDESAQILESMLGCSLHEILYSTEQLSRRAARQARAVESGLDLAAIIQRAGSSAPGADEPLRRTAHAHVAIFAVEYALYRLWESWGIVPAALVGHSLGEYAAACIAGVMSLPDALTLVTRRAEIIESTPAGAMLALAASATDIRAWLPDEICLAAINAPTQCVVAGTSAKVAEITAELHRRGIAHRPVEGAHAFHSSLMQPLYASLVQLFSTVTFRPPRIPYLSNVTGTWISATQVTDPHYWAQHTCQPVRFNDALTALSTAGFNLFVEVGPGQSLSSFLFQCVAATQREQVVALPSLPGIHEQAADEFVIAHALASLWCRGVQPDWQAYHAGEKRHRVSLPTYPFERQACWCEASEIEVPTVPVAPVDPHPVHSRPQSELEHRVTAMWTEVLGRRDIGVHDGFLSLGGSSLLALQVTSRLREAFHVEVSLKNFFANATIHKLAAAVEDLLLAEIEAMSDEEVQRQQAAS